MDTRFKIMPYDHFVSGRGYAYSADAARHTHHAPEERNQVAKGILYSLPISALLWGGLLVMLLHR